MDNLDIKYIENTNPVQPVNTKRRNFLKLLAFGGGAFALGKIFSSFDFFGGSNGAVAMQDFEQFKVSENNHQLTISSKDGVPLFIMDNEK